LSFLPTVGDAGEDSLIELMHQYLSPADDVLLVPAGDDAAVVRLPPEHVEVLTTDLLLEGTHFLRSAHTDWYALGRRAITANLSDLASMGAIPGSGLVSLGLPGEFLLHDVEDLYRGFADEARPANLHLVGGDTARSAHVLINVAVTGYKPEAFAAATRSNCRPDQFVYVSGDGLGGCRAGLALELQRPTAQPWSPAEQRLIKRQQQPTARLALGQALARELKDLAMIDVSDGLYKELTRLSVASGVGFEIQLRKVRLFPGVEDFCAPNNLNPHEFAIFSGEEYELLFTTSLEPEGLATLLTRNNVATSVHCIGKVVRGNEVRLLQNGKVVSVRDQTFSHY